MPTQERLRGLLAEEYDRKHLTSMAHRVRGELPTAPGLDISVAAALAAMSRAVQEAYEEAAILCERNVDGGDGEWDSASKSNAISIRALSTGDLAK